MMPNRIAITFDRSPGTDLTATLEKLNAACAEIAREWPSIALKRRSIVFVRPMTSSLNACAGASTAPSSSGSRSSATLSRQSHPVRSLLCLRPWTASSQSFGSSPSRSPRSSAIALRSPKIPSPAAAARLSTGSPCTSLERSAARDEELAPPSSFATRRRCSASPSPSVLPSGVTRFCFLADTPAPSAQAQTSSARQRQVRSNAYTNIAQISGFSRSIAQVQY